jgi:thiosulfate dehydrogenase (quinone) large subunit
MNADTIDDRILRFIKQELSKEGAYLLPLRLFIGMGWLRAFAEKVANPGWHDGTVLAAFLEERLVGDHVVFPFYRVLITDVFLPNASVLGWIVMIGQLLAGAAILLGLFTNAALLGGLFMNLNFILVGAPNPSAFYFIIQVALFIGGTGAIIGVDALLGRRIRTPLFVAKVGIRSWHFRSKERALLGLTLLTFGLAAYCLAHVRTYDPGLSVEDPAMILTVLFGLSSLQAFVSYLRQQPPETARTSLSGTKAAVSVANGSGHKETSEEPGV